jgi:hypothetical protein
MGSRRRLILGGLALAALAWAPAAAGGAGSLGLSASIGKDGRTVVLQWPSQRPAHVTLTRSPGGRTVAGPGSSAARAVDHVRDNGRTYTWTLRVDESGATASVSLSTKPAPPLALGVSDATGDLSLSWSKSLDADVTRVVVRRSGGTTSRPTCPSTLHAGHPVGGRARRLLQADRRTRAWRRYCYAVFAIDRHGNTSPPALLRAMRPADVGGLRAAAGCTGALVTWSKVSVPGFARVRIVRNARHVPRNAHDGRRLRHHRGELVDRGLHRGHVYHYRVFTVLSRGRGRAPLVSPGRVRTVRTGRICRPRNGQRTTDRTPLLRWAPYRHAFRYAVVLRLGRRTVLAAFSGRSSYQVASSWVFRGRVRRLRGGNTYAVYVYAYTSRRPNGFLIGRSIFHELRSR